MQTAVELKDYLAQFNGTDRYYKKQYLSSKFRYTDGVKYFADNAGEQGAHWFLDIAGTEIISHNKPFALVCLFVENGKAKITAQEDSGIPNFFEREIPLTDCQDGEWFFYLIDGVMLLRNEY